MIYGACGGIIALLADFFKEITMRRGKEKGKTYEEDEKSGKGHGKQQFKSIGGNAQKTQIDAGGDYIFNNDHAGFHLHQHI